VFFSTLLLPLVLSASPIAQVVSANGVCEDDANQAEQDVNAVYFVNGLLKALVHIRASLLPIIG